MISGRFDASEQMIQLITSFPSLTHLSCTGICWPTDGVSTAPHTPLPIGLQIITLDSALSLFLHGLLSLPSHHGLRAIRFHCMSLEHIKSVGMLLETIGSSLEELDLGELQEAFGYKDCNAKGQTCYHLAGNFQ